MSLLKQKYEEILYKKGYKPDQAQLKAIKVLQNCSNNWENYQKQNSSSFKKLLLNPIIPKGVYLYGGVGRGKSFLMDCFFQTAPIKQKVRLHFHEFMREIHKELQKLQGIQNPLQSLGKIISQKYKLICFDEFHISDITDAMILYRLLQSLHENKVGFVITSNFKPEDLYLGGLHRDRIVPAIKLLNEITQIVKVDSGIDYRQLSLKADKNYFYPLNYDNAYSMLEIFKSFNLDKVEIEADFVLKDGRKIKTVKMSDQIIWFEFRELCVNNLAQNDYLEIASKFPILFLSDVPKMKATMPSIARRFTLLIDVLYDRNVQLVVTAADVPEKLYLEGVLAHEFPRTASRLKEMQSEKYRKLAHRKIEPKIV